MEQLSLQQLQNCLQNILETLSCPVCFNTLQSPVKQCGNGHVICSECHSKVNKCPTCYAQYSSVAAKTRLLEEVLDKLPHQCKHKDCEVFVVPGDDHEEWCGFQLSQCEKSLCTWKGCGKDILDHIIENHKTALMEEKKNSRLISKDFSFDKDACTYMPCVNNQDHFFWMKRENHGDSKMCTTKFLIVPNGKPNTGLLVNFVLEKGLKKIDISFDIPVETMLDTDIATNSFTLPSSVFKEFKNEDGNIPYKLFIKQLGL